MSACFVCSLGVRVALVIKNNNDRTSRDTNVHQTIRDIRHLREREREREIPVSFNQAISATTPLFTAILSYVILHKKEAIETYIMLIPVTVGVVIASENEPMFNSYGFVACITATFMRALKSVLQGLILADEKNKLDPFSLLLFMSPIAFTILVLACSMMESNAFEVMSAKMMMSSSTNIVAQSHLDSQLHFSVLGEFEQFYGHKVHESVDFASFRKREECFGGCHIGNALSQSSIAIGMIGYCVSSLAFIFIPTRKVEVVAVTTLVQREW